MGPLLYHIKEVMFYTLDTENCRPLQNSNRQESRYSHEPNSAVHRDAGEKREAASIDRLKLVLETSAGNRLRSPASLSSAAWPDPSGKQRPTTRNRLKNNSSKIGLKQKTLAVLNPRCLTKAPRARCGEGRRATAAELRVNDDRAIRRRASRVRRPTRTRATRHNSDAPKADSSLPSRSRSSSGSSRSTRSQDNRNSPREQMQPRASSLECRPRPDRQVNL